MRAHLCVALIVIGGLVGCEQNGPPVAVGTLERHRIELRAERQEPILRLAVREGDRVEAGDVVAELDRRRVDAQLRQARASRDLADAKLAEVVRGARSEDIEHARSQLEEAEAAIIQKRPDLDRARALVAQGVEPQSVLDTAEAGLAAAEARRDAARATLERRLNGATVEELDQARAEAERTRAEVERLEIDVERLLVTAPRAGIVDALPFKVGDEPPAGAAVAVLLTEGAPFARVYVPAELRSAAAPGAIVAVSVDGYAQSFEGQLRYVASEAAFTPYFALTERDRGHLAYLAEIDLVGETARELPTGLPVEVTF
jgi:HlyD family secretion protein